MSSTDFPPVLAELEQHRRALELGVAADEAEPLAAALEQAVAELRAKHPALVRRWCGDHVETLRRQRDWTRGELAQLEAARASWTPEQRAHASERLGFLTDELALLEGHIRAWREVRAGTRAYVLHHYPR